jgi:hypothetical protein
MQSFHTLSEIGNMDNKMFLDLEAIGLKTTTKKDLRFLDRSRKLSLLVKIQELEDIWLIAQTKRQRLVLFLSPIEPILFPRYLLELETTT